MDNTEKIQRTFKEKMEQYKKKLVGYKQRNSEKEKEVQALQRKNEEDNNKKQKNIELLERKLQEQADYFEQTTRMLEEENYIRTVRGYLIEMGMICYRMK